MTKTVSKAVEYTNGDTATSASGQQPALSRTAGREASSQQPFVPPIHKMDGFPRKYLQRLIDNHTKAREQLEKIQLAANDFIVAYAEEQGIALGEDGWSFDQDNLEFFQVGGGADGDNR